MSPKEPNRVAQAGESGLGQCCQVLKVFARKRIVAGQGIQSCYFLRNVRCRLLVRVEIIVASRQEVQTLSFLGFPHQTSEFLQVDRDALHVGDPLQIPMCLQFPKGEEAERGQNREA